MLRPYIIIHIVLPKSLTKENDHGSSISRRPYRQFASAG